MQIALILVVRLLINCHVISIENKSNALAIAIAAISALAIVALSQIFAPETPRQVPLFTALAVEGVDIEFDPSSSGSVAVSPDGTGWTQGGISWAQATVADAEGNIWIANCGNESVTVFPKRNRKPSPPGASPLSTALGASTHGVRPTYMASLVRASSAFWLAQTMPKPAGSIRPFCEPVTAQSTPHSSMRKSMLPIELTPSTKSSAG